MSYSDPSFASTIMPIAILFLISIIAVIFYIFCLRYTAPHPLQEATLMTWPTYAEAIRQDPRAASADCCSICLTDYGEEGEDSPLVILPDCGHVFHATCMDQWLQQHRSCPMCRSQVMIGRLDSA